MENEALFIRPNDSGELVLYQPHEQLAIEVRLERETVWLTQQQMSLLFDVKENNITYHIKEIYKTQELEPEATTQKIRVVRKEGKRQVARAIDFYNLDMIISVGYRVNSSNATQFRRWATSVLKEYLLRGYAINQRLLIMEERIDRRLAQHDNQLREHQQKIDFFVRTNLPPIEQVFFNGEFFEARLLLEHLVKTARKRVIVVDAYVDATTFDILRAREENTLAEIYSGKDLTTLRDAYNSENSTKLIDTFVWSKPSHDRWLIIDESLYHCGHSLKDMGRKMSAITRLDTPPDIILKHIK